MGMSWFHVENVFTCVVNHTDGLHQKIRVGRDHMFAKMILEAAGRCYLCGQEDQGS